MEAAAPATIQYLTVQDVLWLHQKATGKPGTFSYSKLEDTVYRQYSYGEAKGVVPQAVQFFTGFLKAQPFGSADPKTAFLGLAAFLAANGRPLDLPAAEAKTWLERATGGHIDAAEAIARLAGSGGALSVKEAMEHAAALYAAALA